MFINVNEHVGESALSCVRNGVQLNGLFVFGLSTISPNVVSAQFIHNSNPAGNLNDGTKPAHVERYHVDVRLQQSAK